MNLGSKEKKDSLFWSSLIEHITSLYTEKDDDLSLYEVINTCLQTFLKFPNVNSSSLFMLDDDTYDFYHSTTFLSEKGKKNELNKHVIIRQFQHIVISGELAITLNDNKITTSRVVSSKNKESKFIIIPLSSHMGVIGVVLLNVEKFFDSEAKFHYCSLSTLANKMAYLICNINTVNQLNTEKSILKQQIAARTKSISDIQRDMTTIFNSVKIGIVVIDPVTESIIKVNNTALKLTECEESKLLDEKYYNFLEEIPDHEDSELKKEKRNNFESHLKKCTGGILPILRSRNEILLNGEKKILESFTDLRKLKTIEEALKTSESRLKLALETTNNSIWDWNIVDDKYYLDTHLLKMLGYESKKADLNIHSLQELIHPDDLKRFRDTLGSCLDSKNSHCYCEFRVKNKKGSWQWILAKGSTVEKDKDNNPSRMIGIFQDITQQKEAELIQSALYQISESVNITQDMNNLHHKIHSIIQGLMPAENFYIAIYDRHKDIVHFPYFVDENDPHPGSMRPGKTLTSLVLNRGKPLLVNPDLYKELYLNGSVDRVGSLAVDWLGVPLKDKNKTFGALVVQSYNKSTRYTQENLKILVFVSEQIANAIQRKKAQDDLTKALEATKYAYDKLENTQEELIKIEQKNTALAMAVTANHEINQPLMIIKGNRDILAQKISNADENHQYMMKYLNGIDLAVERIEQILLKFRNIENLTFKDYSEGTDMLDF